MENTKLRFTSSGMFTENRKESRLRVISGSISPAFFIMHTMEREDIIRI